MGPVRVGAKTRDEGDPVKNGYANTEPAPAKSERKTEARQRLISEHIIAAGPCTAQDLALAFGVSIMTVHRDLDVLERRGIVRKFRGGVTAQPSGVFESQLSYRMTSNQVRSMNW